MIETIVGYVAGGLGLILYMPQIVKAAQSKSTKDLSRLMCIFIVVDAIIWVVYGSMRNDQVIIYINFIITIISSVQLGLKLRFG